MVLWRVPPQVQENIQFGQRGPAVAWLDAQLADGQGRASPSGGDPVFDEALSRRVKQFQLAHGLIPDGIVGLQTLVRLSGVSDRTAPNLLRERGAQ